MANNALLVWVICFAAIVFFYINSVQWLFATRICSRCKLVAVQKPVGVRFSASCPSTSVWTFVALVTKDGIVPTMHRVKDFAQRMVA